LQIKYCQRKIKKRKKKDRKSGQDHQVRHLALALTLRPAQIRIAAHQAIQIVLQGHVDPVQLPVPMMMIPILTAQTHVHRHHPVPLLDRLHEKDVVKMVLLKFDGHFRLLN